MVRQEVTAGLYALTSEVVTEALDLTAEKDNLRLAKIDQLRQEIQDGLQSGSAVRLDPDDIKGAGRARHAAKVQAH
jgi:antitoxin ParD1/3/4